MRLLQRFRHAVLEVAAEHGVTDVREAHLPVLGNVGVDGVRLTTLARRAQLSLAACAELVDDLQRKDYLERRRDPTDGRAKLIVPTPRGRELLELAGRRVAEIETAWGDRVGPTEFEQAMRTLDRLVAILDEEGGGRDV
ncbi:transcriptional regulator, MarR family [Pseudonocardia sp. N23]|nr:transcriptional regulator, MarR family [Pseudonocardia sp. N23]